MPKVFILARIKTSLILLFTSSFFIACTNSQVLPPKIKPTHTEKKIQKLHVTSTAYTSRKKETDSSPTIAAWNNKLSPHKKSIAVSRDLLKMGLGNGTRVQVKGLSGTYTVRDKMNKRWRKKIDIYMGNNLQKAKQWGNRKVTIYWENKTLSLN